MDNMEFKSRKEILEGISKSKMSYQNDIINKAKNIDINNVSDTFDDSISMEILEKSKVYIWTRLYLSNEYEISQGDNITFIFKGKGKDNILNMTFVSYAKKDDYKSSDNNYDTKSYNPDDDKTILCCYVVDSDLQKNELPQRLFKQSKFYEPDIIRKTDMKFIHDSKNRELEFIKFDF